VLLHATPVVGVSQTLRRWTEGATYIRQGDHHVGHWPTFLVLLLFFFPRLISAVADWMSIPYFHTWCGLSANLECRSGTCCTWLAGNAGCKKSPKSRHLGTIAQLCRAISSQLRQSEKNLLSSHISSRCPHNMVNFGLLAAEIDPVVWGTVWAPTNFNSFRVLAALLHGSHVVGVSQTLRR